MVDNPPNPSNAPPPHNEGFTEGGDLTLRSSDDMDFHVHSMLLSLASPVFSDMLKVGSPDSESTDRSRKDVITLGETAEMVALMLKFIYPVSPPTISSFEQMSEAFHVTDKYQLNGMKSQLRERLLVHGSPVSMQADPLRALAVASAHGLPETDVIISHALKRHDFQQPHKLIELARLIPSAVPAIRLIGTQTIQTITLAEVLFSFHKAPMYLYDSHRQLTCSNCTSSGSQRYSPPEWQARWAHVVYTELKGIPLQDWAPFFKHEFLTTAWYRSASGNVPTSYQFQGQCRCSDTILRNAGLFEQWTSKVHEHLKKCLQCLDQLEDLKVA